MDRRGFLLAAPLASLLPAAAAAAPQDALAVIAAFVAAINAHDVDRLDALYAADAYVNHQPLAAAAPAGVAPAAAVKAYMAQRLAAFPDLTLGSDVAFANGEMAAANLIWRGTQRGAYLGIPPSGRQAVWNSTDLFRVRDGRFVEHWGAVDLYGLAQQLRG